MKRTLRADKETGKPLVWDTGESKAKVFDNAGIIDWAIEGKFQANDLECQPSFQLVKHHLKQYTAEMASRISSVPAETIRRIATEYAQAAQVGSTIIIDGHQLPLRPVSSVTFRGAEAHENSAHTVLAFLLLNQIVGGG